MVTMQTIIVKHNSIITKVGLTFLYINKAVIGRKVIPINPKVMLALRGALKKKFNIILIIIEAAKDAETIIFLVLITLSLFNFIPPLWYSLCT